MVCLSRTIDNKCLSLCIDESFYNNNRVIIENLCSTFSPTGNQQIVTNSLFIYPDTICSFEKKHTHYYVGCDVKSSSWVFHLLCSLEEYFAIVLNTTILHGASVRLKNKNIILMGERRSGKTTLARYLVYEKNASFLEDDCVYIVNGKCIGFAMPISLRGKVNICKKNVICNTVDYDNVSRTLIKPKNSIQTLPHIDVIIFPKYSPDARYTVECLSKGNLFNSVINNVRNSKNLKELFQDINNIIQNSEAYSISYNSSKVAYEQLVSIID